LVNKAIRTFLRANFLILDIGYHAFWKMQYPRLKKSGQQKCPPPPGARVNKRCTTFTVEPSKENRNNNEGDIENGTPRHRR
jgi:hypothetical protein